MSEPVLDANAAEQWSLGRLGSTIGKIYLVVLALWAFLEIANHFLPNKPLAAYRETGLVVFFLVAALIGLAIELRMLRQAYVRGHQVLQETKSQNKELHSKVAQSNQDAAHSLLAALREAYQRRDWGEVILLGRPLSRPLWLTGRYHLRLEIGKLVETAAAFSERLDVQAATLIDDLGWTSVALRRYDEAIAHVQNGLNIAKAAKAHPLACRALRHLAGICVKQGKLDQAEAYCDQAEEALRLVSPGPECDELVAGLAYQRATQLHARGDHSGALSGLITAQELFMKLADRDRAIKLYGPIGHVHFAVGNLVAAKDSFRRGLATARVSSRHDCELVSLLGLAKVAQAEESYPEARALLREASAVALLLGDANLAAETELKAKKLEA